MGLWRQTEGSLTAAAMEFVSCGRGPSLLLIQFTSQDCNCTQFIGAHGA
jgi:hypothetical protein